jgi:hypothetical protein
MRLKLQTSELIKFFEMKNSIRFKPSADIKWQFKKLHIMPLISILSQLKTAF